MFDRGSKGDQRFDRAGRRPMTADLTQRLGEIGAVLAERMPLVIDATIAIFESILPVLEDARPARYQIGPPIGIGGMAEVLLGTLRGAHWFHRRVALKRLRSDRSDDGRFATMLAEEAHVASYLFHPNVVPVLDLDLDPAGRPLLVMEYIDGIDLAELIEAGPVPHAVAIYLLRELLAGLGYLHQLRFPGGVRCMIHRDVKPSNIRLSWAGEVKLADFGLARMIDRSITIGAAERGGTPGYMSPEQASSRGSIDSRSDLYAAGVVLWELLAEQRLRVGLRGDRQARVDYQAIPRASQHRPQIPADLEAVALRLLAYDRRDRYPTADLAAGDLLRCQDHPRDGRGDLVRLLDERFPRGRRRRPSSGIRPELGRPTESTRTLPRR